MKYRHGLKKSNNKVPFLAQLAQGRGFRGWVKIVKIKEFSLDSSDIACKLGGCFDDSSVNNL